MERVKKMVPGTPKSLPDNWNYRNAFVTLFMAAVFSSDCTESDTGPFQLQQVSIVTNI